MRNEASYLIDTHGECKRACECNGVAVLGILGIQSDAEHSEKLAMDERTEKAEKGQIPRKRVLTS